MKTALPNPKPSKGRSRYPRWTLKDRTQVRVEDMSDRHVIAVIAYLERRAQERWPSFAAECYDAIATDEGEMGLTTPDEVFDTDPRDWEVCLHPMHEHLVAEANRRGIDVEALTRSST